MKKTLLLILFLIIALSPKSKAQHFIASHGVQHNWSVPRLITDVVYDHYYDYNWVHAARIYTPRGFDYHVVLQRNDLFVEVELSYDGYIRNVEYFDYYPLDDHVCVDFCGFHSPFYNSYYNARPARFSYGLSFVLFRPRIRTTYYHPYRYTRRARYYNVYSPYRYRRNYTRVYRRADHHFYGDRYYGARNNRNRRTTYNNANRENRRTYRAPANSRSSSRSYNNRPYESRSNNRISGRTSNSGTSRNNRSTTTRPNSQRRSSGQSISRSSRGNSPRSSRSNNVTRQSNTSRSQGSNVSPSRTQRSSTSPSRSSRSSSSSSVKRNTRSNSSKSSSSKVSRSSNKRSSSGRSSSSNNSSRSRSRGN